MQPFDALKKHVLFLAFLLISLIAAVPVYGKPKESAASLAMREAMKSAPELKRTVEGMAKELVQNLEMTATRRVSPSEGLLVCTFVDLKKLYRTSSFGRYIAEQLLSEFQQQGFRVVELRKSASVMVQEKHGEYGLSRDPDEISPETAASAMLTGTYMPTAKHIIVNARIIDNRDATLLSSATVLFPKNALTEQLLADASAGVKKARGPLYMKRLEL